MAKKLLFFVFSATFSLLHGQTTLCPGGGFDYVDAVAFQGSWVYGCSTGTSCNGGTNFDNRTACEPTAAVDPCPPQPTGSNASRLGSDLWYKFEATDTLMFLQVIKNVSLMASIQLFRDTTGCGDLQELDVAYSANPSGPVNITRTNMVIGDTYVFRVFGHSNPVSQRTGVFCFCGSSGLFPASILPLNLINFDAKLSTASSVNIFWHFEKAEYFSHFELERKSTNGVFEKIATFYANGVSSDQYNYNDILEEPIQDDVQYRLKMVDLNGSFKYSDIKSIFATDLTNYSLVSSSQSLLKITSLNGQNLELLNTQGITVNNISLVKGLNEVQVALPKGFYLLRDAKGGVQRFSVY